MSRRRRPLLVALIVAALAGASSGCRHRSDFIWVDQVPKTALETRSNRVVLAPGDVIGVRVFNQDANSVDRTPVREDGRISLPLLYDLDVAGMEPAELARRLEVKLKAFVVNPNVTVVVHERRPLRISVLGEIRTPGTYSLEPDAGVLHAIAAAGGLTDFADRDRVFVLRSGYWADSGNPGRIRFSYTALARGTPPGAMFRLRPGDIVVVE